MRFKSRGILWLKFEEKENAMFCSYCRQFSKDKSAFGAHKTAKLAHDASNAQPGTAPLEACLINMEREALDRLVKLFHTVYYLIRAEQPFRDFVGLCSLQERNGVNTGKSYRNDKQAATFTHYIAETVEKDFANKLRQAKMFSVLNDSSTDISVTDEELVYVRYLEDGKPVTKFLSIQALAKADAVGIVAAIDKAFLDETDMQPNEWHNKTVGMSTDGASVMIGIGNGVVTMIKADLHT